MVHLKLGGVCHLFVFVKELCGTLAACQQAATFSHWFTFQQRVVSYVCSMDLFETNLVFLLPLCLVQLC
jgi:hypothetical protein